MLVVCKPEESIGPKWDPGTERIFFHVQALNPEGFRQMVNHPYFQKLTQKEQEETKEEFRKTQYLAKLLGLPTGKPGPA